MKVALISFHNAYNYGAALQAYALQRAIQNMAIECEYIDYQNEHRSHTYDMQYQFKNAIKNKKIMQAGKTLAGMPVLNRRGKKFDAFYARYLKKTNKTYKNSTEAEKLNDSFDKFIVGSDQIWNYSHNGEDFAYLLNFVNDNTKKISYSSSFGMDSIPDRLKTDYSECLSAFNRLAVRETIGVKLVQQLTGREPHLVLDPVFLISKEEWMTLKESPQKYNKPYIFFYTNRQSQIQDFLNTGYKGTDDFHVLSSQVTPKEIVNPRMKMRVDISPEQFLEEINSAKMVVTASFHCLAFAIIFRKPFCAILTGDQGKDERILNLLELTGLKDRILYSNTSIHSLLKPIDYDEVWKKLDKYIIRSKTYLKNAINDFPDVEIKNETDQTELFCRDNRCVGCSACAAVCSNHAIIMEENHEGFMTPNYNEQMCVHCGLCHKVCPVFKQPEKRNDQKYYGVKNAKSIRIKSSSGGMFRALAASVIEQEGIICAAAMDKNFRVYHAFAENMGEIKPMCATYYVQSEMGDAFSIIKKHLAERKVLFVGTPCQVAGLKGYLQKEYDNLITCDIICHGVPSPMVFRAFIKELQKKGKLSSFKFRDKRLGWRGYCVSAVINRKYIHDKLWLQSFSNLFSHNMINRLSCGACQYTNYDRPGDITIGDFWGIEKNKPEFTDKLGVSLVITNTDKGAKLFSSLEKLEKIEVLKDETVQNSLVKPAKISMKRTQVFQTIRSRGYSEVMNKYAEVNIKGKIKNLIRKAAIK